jgi:O-antigen/teichoic acid export membrane protein
MALDVLTPPLSLLAAAHGLMLATSVTFAAVTGAWMPAAISTIGLALFAWFLLIGWLRHGRGRIGWREALSLPRHVGRIAGFGLSFLGRHRSGWTRADRSSRAP